MGGSRRKYKASRTKVRVALPKKKPGIVKPCFNLPAKLRALIDPLGVHWDEKGSVISNYKSFGFVSNPNLLSVVSRTAHMVESKDLQLPSPSFLNVEKADEFEPIDSGSDLEEDDLKTALGKKRRDGKSAPLQPLTANQRRYIVPLIEKYGDNYERMFRDTKLNTMQHSVATLEKLCKRYRLHKDKNPLLLIK